MSEPAHITAARFFQNELGAQIVPLHGILDGPAGSICRCRDGASCTNAGKHPAMAWKGKASKLPNLLNNWGYVSDHIVVLDFDRGDIEVPWELPDTYRVRTRKGFHLLFRWDGAPLRMRIGIIPGLDIKGSGGLTVGPYSRRIDGGIYEPMNELPMEPLPKDIAMACGYAAQQTVPTGSIIETTSPWAQQALDALCEEIRTLPQGTRNDTLYRTMFRAFRAGWLGRDALPSIVQCAMDSGLDRYEVERTMNSAYRAVFAE